MADEKILSQDESDALLNDDGAETGQTAVPDANGIQQYDFRRARSRSNAHLPELESVNERLATNLQIQLSTLLRRPVKVTAEAVDSKNYAEYSNSLSLPFSVQSVRVLPFHKTLLVCVDARLVFMFVDAYFGGQGHSSDPDPEHDFTPTEQRMNERLLQHACRDLDAAWAPVSELRFELEQNKPELSNALEDDTDMVISRFQVELESGSGQLHVVIPHSLMELLVPSSTESIQVRPVNDTNLWRESLVERVSDAKVEIKSLLAEVEITLGELTRLQTGDLIPISMKDMVTVYAEGVPLFEARAGDSNGVASARLVERCKQIH